jgi:endogenous inhibitor of DNA gyrase (YacG/DUF329 family)
MKFPIITESQVDIPIDGKCPCCGKTLSEANGEFVTLETGALLLDEAEDSIVSDSLEGFATIVFHSDPKNIYVASSLVENAHGGQGEITLCSTQCLRALLNKWVDQLEVKINHEK